MLKEMRIVERRLNFAAQKEKEIEKKKKSDRGTHVQLPFSINHITVVLLFISPCNLNASIGKQPTVTFSVGIYTPVAVEKRSRSKLIRRPNVFINSCQL